MLFLIILLTFAMVLNCIILVFLVLIQLPKKEAGGVLAFGASGADALFGAGSGTMLTKITKYAAAAFFILAIVLSLMWSAYHNRGASAFTSGFEKGGQQTAPAHLPPATTPSTPPPSSTPGTLTGTNPIPLTISTTTPPNLGPVESTNAPAITNPIQPPK